MELPRIILTPGQRKRAYQAGNALVAIAVTYGLLNGEQAAAFGLLVNALLGMASANVPTEPTRDFYLEED